MAVVFRRRVSTASLTTSGSGASLPHSVQKSRSESLTGWRRKSRSSRTSPPPPRGQRGAEIVVGLAVPFALIARPAGFGASAQANEKDKNQNKHQNEKGAFLPG